MTVEVYTSVADAPVDPYLVPDEGDQDSHLQTEPPPRSLAAARKIEEAKAALPQALVVPFVRALSLGSWGRDVVGAKRAIWRANGLSLATSFTRLLGPIAVRELRTFQRRHGLAPDGTLGPATLRRLGPFFDQYAFFLYEGYPPGATVQQRIVTYSLWGYNNRALIHYGEFRPMTFLADLEHLPVTDDCSTRATKAYKFGGAADPNGLSFDGYGNTGTERQHGRQVSLVEAAVGDLVHYDSPQHVAVYVGHGRVVSHGSEIGPLLLPVTYRPVAQVRRYI